VIHDPFGRVAMLQVEDSGPGIPADEREKVFAPFYRALGTNVDGSGLGLAIVREIAEQHGAEVTLDEAHPRHPVPKEFMDNAASAAGVGALFTLKFKALPAEPEPSPSAQQSADLH
jgi:two-component system sensor histidine kinase TctE